MVANQHDIETLEKLYEGRRPFYGELHDHAATGGTSDGKRTLDHWLGAMEALKLDFAGVDLLPGASGPLVCEVNSNAHFAGLMQITGVNPADHIISYIRRTL